jgi:hypothetical protein
MRPSQQFDWDALSPATQRGLDRAAQEAHRIIFERQRRAVPIVNTWQIVRLEKMGRHDPVIAAATAMVGLVYNPKEVNTYDVTFYDGAGAPLDGSNRYVLHLDPPPPVNAFWSVSMYSVKTFGFVEKPINLYSLGDRTRGIVYGADRSPSVAS